MKLLIRNTILSTVILSCYVSCCNYNFKNQTRSKFNYISSKRLLELMNASDEFDFSSNKKCIGYLGSDKQVHYLVYYHCPSARGEFMTISRKTVGLQQIRKFPLEEQNVSLEIYTLLLKMHKEKIKQFRYMTILEFKIFLTDNNFWANSRTSGIFYLRSDSYFHYFVYRRSLLSKKQYFIKIERATINLLIKFTRTIKNLKEGVDISKEIDLFFKRGRKAGDSVPSKRTQISWTIQHV